MTSLQDQQELYCTIVQEILPELENKLSQKYQMRLMEVEKSYEDEKKSYEDEKKAYEEEKKGYEEEVKFLKKQLEIQKKHSQLGMENSQSEVILSRRINMLENERRNWVKMETMYQETIHELTDRINSQKNERKSSDGHPNSDSGASSVAARAVRPTEGGDSASKFWQIKRNETELSEISSIEPPPSIFQHPLKEAVEDGAHFHTQIMSYDSKRPPAQNISSQGFMRNSPKAVETWENTIISKVHGEDEQDEELQSGKRGECASAGGEENMEVEGDGLEGRYLYESVLSPPRAEVREDRAGIKKGPILWDQDKKRQLINLIKLK